MTLSIINPASLPADYKSPYVAQEVFQYLGRFLNAQDTFVDMLKDPSNRIFLQYDHGGSEGLSKLEQSVAEGKVEPWMTELKPDNYKSTFSSFFYQPSNPSMSAEWVSDWLSDNLPNALAHLKTTDGFKNFEEVQPDLAIELVGALDTSAKNIVDKIRGINQSHGNTPSEYCRVMTVYAANEGRKDFQKVLAAYDALKTVYREVEALDLE